MMFTTKAEYGVRLLIELGRQAQLEGTGTPVSLKAIADAEMLPLAYLERIVAKLKKAGFVESTRGAHGGYRLALDPTEIRMDEVIIALEGQLRPMTCFASGELEEADTEVAGARSLCNHVGTGGHTCATKLLWTRVQGGIQNALAGTTLAELVDFALKNNPKAASGTAAA